jgi:hypothetical protein
MVIRMILCTGGMECQNHTIIRVNSSFRRPYAEKLTLTLTIRQGQHARMACFANSGDIGPFRHPNRLFSGTLPIRDFALVNLFSETVIFSHLESGSHNLEPGLVGTRDFADFGRFILGLRMTLPDVSCIELNTVSPLGSGESGDIANPVVSDI